MIKNIVKEVIYAGGWVRVFCGQTICVGIKYADTWFPTLKCLIFNHTRGGNLNGF